MCWCAMCEFAKCFIKDTSPKQCIKTHKEIISFLGPMEVPVFNTHLEECKHQDHPPWPTAH